MMSQLTLNSKNFKYEEFIWDVIQRSFISIVSQRLINSRVGIKSHEIVCGKLIQEE